MNVVGLNTLDLILIVILFIGVMVGFVRGAVRQIISVVSIWLGLVVTLWLYKPFSDYMLQDVLIDIGIGTTGSDVLAFLILLAVFFGAFSLLIKYLAVPPEEKKKKRRKRDEDDPLAEAAKTTSERAAGCFNAIGGIVMGFILTTLWLALFLGVLQFILQPTATEIPYSGLARGLVTNMRSSLLMPWFNSVLWALSTSLSFFIPKNADIFESVLNQIIGTTG